MTQPALKKNPARGRGFIDRPRVTRWFAVSSGLARVDHSNRVGAAPGKSRHHEHLSFAAETVGAVSSGFYREGPRVHPRVVSFLTTHSKLVAAVPVPASIPELSVVSSLLLEQLVRIKRQARIRVETKNSFPDSSFLS